MQFLNNKKYCCFYCVQKINANNSLNYTFCFWTHYDTVNKSREACIDTVCRWEWKQDMAALCSSTQLNTESNNTFERQHWRHCSCFTSQWSYIQSWHSTQSKQTQRSHHFLQQAPWWMSSQKAASAAPSIHPNTTGQRLRHTAAAAVAVASSGCHMRSFWSYLDYRNGISAIDTVGDLLSWLQEPLEGFYFLWIYITLTLNSWFSHRLSMVLFNSENHLMSVA